MVSIDYQNAYVELLEIFKELSDDELNKIPKGIIEYMKANRNKNYKFSYNKYKTLNEQDVSNITKQIIIILFKRYFANEQQKKWIIRQKQLVFNEEEREKSVKYNPNNIFKKLDTSNEMQLEVIDETNNSFIDKILDLIFGKRIDI